MNNLQYSKVEFVQIATELCKPKRYFVKNAGKKKPCKNVRQSVRTFFTLIGKPINVGVGVGVGVRIGVWFDVGVGKRVGPSPTDSRWTSRHEKTFSCTVVNLRNEKPARLWLEFEHSTLKGDASTP